MESQWKVENNGATHYPLRGEKKKKIATSCPTTSNIFKWSNFFGLFVLYWGYPVNNVLIISSEQRRGSAILPQTPLHPGCHIRLSRVPCAVQRANGRTFLMQKKITKIPGKKYVNNFRVGKGIFKTSDLKEGIPLVVEWIRTCRPIQGIWIGSQVREDCTCLRAAEACAPQLLSTCAATSDACALEPMPQERSHRSEKPEHHQQE